VGINGWLLVWLIVNALFVVWRVLVVSSEKEPPGRSIRSEGAGHATFSTDQRHRIGQQGNLDQQCQPFVRGPRYRN
jgi:hypothetical protein